MSLVCATPLQAYVPHPLHMLDLMLGTPPKVTSAKLDQRVTIHSFDPNTPPQIRQGSVYFQWPRGYRMESVGEVGHHIQVVAGDDSVVVRDGFIETAPSGNGDCYFDLLFYRTRSAMAQRLSRLGIDIRTAGPGLWHGQPHWVIGAVYPDTAKSQLWIDKESFRPLGWRFSSAGEPGYPIWEIRYASWQQKNGFRYPRRILFYQDEVLIQEVELSAVTVNPALPADLFDLGKLRSEYAVRQGGETAGQSGGEVQQVIDDFRKMYRP